VSDLTEGMTGGSDAALAIRQRDGWCELAIELGDDVAALREALAMMRDDFAGQINRFGKPYDQGLGWRLADAALARSAYKPVAAPTPPDLPSLDAPEEPE
jgi:hypothetical protein